MRTFLELQILLKEICLLSTFHGGQAMSRIVQDQKNLEPKIKINIKFVGSTQQPLLSIKGNHKAEFLTNHNAVRFEFLIMILGFLKINCYFD